METKVYDKAKWHFGGEGFPEELDDYQGYVHTGMYIGWLINNDFLETEDDAEIKNALAMVKDRQMTGTAFYMQYLDGVFTSDDVKEHANQFTKQYLENGTGEYLNDYDDTLTGKLPHLYYVQDTWDNYDRLKMVIDKRYQKWLSRKDKPFWKFW